MFFVFYPIEVVILNENKKVVDLKENFKPFKFWISAQKGKYVVELALPHPQISLGDHLTFSTKNQ